MTQVKTGALSNVSSWINCFSCVSPQKVFSRRYHHPSHTHQTPLLPKWVYTNLYSGRNSSILTLKQYNPSHLKHRRSYPDGEVGFRKWQKFHLYIFFIITHEPKIILIHRVFMTSKVNHVDNVTTIPNITWAYCPMTNKSYYSSHLLGRSSMYVLQHLQPLWREALHPWCLRYE